MNTTRQRHGIATSMHSTTIGVEKGDSRSSSLFTNITNSDIYKTAANL